MDKLIKSTFEENINKTPDQILIPYRNKDKWGVCDKNKNIIVEPIYNDVERFHNGLLRITKIIGGLCRFGIINQKGQEILPCIYSIIYKFQFGLAIVVIDGKRGVIDLKGELIISCRYNQRLDILNEKFIRVGYGLNIGIINLKGKRIVPFKYNDVHIHSVNLISVSKGNKQGLFNFKGEVMFPVECDTINFKCKDYFILTQNNKKGLLSKKGDLIFPIIYFDIEIYAQSIIEVIDENNTYLYQIHNGKIIHSEYEELYPLDEYNSLIAVKKDKKWGIINGMNELLVKFQFNSLGALKDYICILKRGDKFGFINFWKKIKVPCKYNSIDNFSGGISLATKNNERIMINHFGKEIKSNKYNQYKCVSKKYTAFKNNSKWGIINASGDEIVPLKYDKIKEEVNGIIRVMQEDLWGLLDNKCVEILPCNFNSIEYFNKKYFKVQNKTDYKWGLVKLTGKIIIPCEYKIIIEGKNGLIRVEDTILSGKYISLFNKAGRNIIPKEYSVLGDYHNDYIRIVDRRFDLFGKVGVMSIHGKIIIPCLYDYIDEFNDGFAMTYFYNDRLDKLKPLGYIDLDGTQYWGSFENIKVLNKEKIANDLRELQNPTDRDSPF